MKKMLIIGLTGQTGAGKSTVSEILEKYGCYHIDADKVAHEILENDKEVQKKLKERFGEDITDKSGKIDRKILAARAFADKDSTLALNAITHPAVNNEIQNIILKQKEYGTKAVIIDAIALFESGEAKICDYTVAVTAPREIRLERITARDKISVSRANERINAQKDESFFTLNADYIINNCEPYNIYDETEKLAYKLKLKKE